jgi:excinuclease ABC subunit A
MAVPKPSDVRQCGRAPVVRVRGARVHNLQDLDVEIPRDRLVVLTGVSGSGKSSLAFDTLFAEGQRRYIESLSSYARQFLDQLERPDVDLIEGLPPPVSIDQKTGAANPRSTVATITEIADYLRLLYARAGVPHCPNCGEPIRRQTPEQIVATVLGMQEGRKVLVLAPLVRGRKGQHAEAFQAVRRAGLLRVRVDGQVIEVCDEPKLAKTKPHNIEAVVDRLVVREGIRPRLAESINLALKLGEGTILLSTQEGERWEDRVLSLHYACPRCGTGIAELEPRTFSFNSPHGACPTCDGLGTLSAFDEELVLPDRSKSLAEGAVAAWPALRPRTQEALANDPALAAFLKRHRLSRAKPLASWSPKAVRAFWEGHSESGFAGILPQLERIYAEAKTEAQRTALEPFRDHRPCPACGGARLRPEARAVRLGGRAIHEVCDLAITAVIGFFTALRFEPPLDAVGPPLVAEIVRRLEFLERVGLGYLTLGRGADTLSGGELQRVRLASQIGSGLVGVCYILDEPTTGLHPRDTSRLLDSLAELRDQGNSVLVVGHDETTIRAADWLIELGPGAGPEGGRIVAEGTVADVLQKGESVTARYLRMGDRQWELGHGERLSQSPGWITIHNATEHNLKGVVATLPLGAFTCVTGVSGSGKSTLVLDILARAALRACGGVGPRPGAFERIEGLEALDKVVPIDQTPIGRTPRSTPATYTGVFDEIRKVYAQTREAKVRGYQPNRFSFNVKGGRCEVCQGQGMRRIEMNFLPDLYVRCEACGGQRFNRPTLDIRFKGHSIGEVLDLRVDEAIAVFDAIPRVLRGLEELRAVGLGYITLGQSSTTLSGGEAQRVKLAAELGRTATGKTLYILDEPTTGLHFADVERLLRVLQRLAELGNTVVVIEHNLDVVRRADWIIDLGPEGGEQGGRIVAMGPPREVAATEQSYTGYYLQGGTGD